MAFFHLRFVSAKRRVSHISDRSNFESIRYEEMGQNRGRKGAQFTGIWPQINADNVD